MDDLKELNLMYLKGLPEYLQHDLDAFIKGYTENSSLMNCYYCELQASINSSEVDKEISSYHANYLRYHI